METKLVDQSASNVDISDVSNKNKRKLSMEESEDALLNPAKRATVHIIPSYYDISNEIQMEIIKNLDTDSIINFSQTCSRFHELCLDKKYWITIDSTKNALPIPEVLARLNRVEEATKTFKVKGNSAKGYAAINARPFKARQTLKDLVNGLKQRSPLLENLHLEQLWYDFKLMKPFKIKEFPSELKSLTFKKIIYINTRGHKRESKIFTGIDSYMTNLTELRLIFCNFFETNDLTAFSKIPNLKILSLQGCKKLKNCVPYLSLSCRFGFVKLESFDLRETAITDSELQCLNMLPNLKEILVQRPVEKVKRPKVERGFYLKNTNIRNPNYDPNAFAVKNSMANFTRYNTRHDYGDNLEFESDGSLSLDGNNAAQRASAIACREAVAFATREAIANLKKAGVSKDAIAGASIEAVANALKNAVASTSQADVAGPTEVNEHGVRYDSDTEDSDDAFFVSGMHHNPRFDSDSDDEPAQVEARFIRIAVNNNNGLLVAEAAGQPVNPNGEPANVDNAEVHEVPAPPGAVVRLFVGSPEFGNRFLRLNEMSLPPGCNEYPTGITDRGFLGFGVPRPELTRDLVFLRALRRDHNTYLERVTIRQYPRVTDTTLSHLSTNAPNLTYIDITGCEQITDAGIEDFKMLKPNCRVVAEDRNMF